MRKKLTTRDIWMISIVSLVGVIVIVIIIIGVYLNLDTVSYSIKQSIPLRLTPFEVTSVDKVIITRDNGGSSLPPFSKTITTQDEIKKIYKLLYGLPNSPDWFTKSHSCPPLQDVSYQIDFSRNGTVIARELWVPGGWCSYVTLEGHTIRADNTRSIDDTMLQILGLPHDNSYWRDF